MLLGSNVVELLKHLVLCLELAPVPFHLLVGSFRNVVNEHGHEDGECNQDECDDSE